MNKAYEMRCVELTREVLDRFWQLDCEFLLDLVTDDVMWIAPEQERYMRGIDAMRADLLANREELVSCHISSAEFDVVLNSGPACSVVGRYLVSTDDDAPYFLQVQQRCQFIWRLMDGQLRVCSVYVSHPRGELAVADGETFANALGSMASRYLEARVASAKDHRRLVFTEELGGVRFLPLVDVVAVVAHRKHCEVRTLDAVYAARAPLGSLREQLPGDLFVEAHRSYMVNVNYVVSVRPYEVSMADGKAIPIPRHRYAQVRDGLMRLHSGQ